MRKEAFFRMGEVEARALLAEAEVVHVAGTSEDGTPILRELHAVLLGDRLLFHAAPVGEKTLALGRRAVASASRIVARVPSHFTDPERACPATTFYRAVQAHGTLERVDDPEAKAAMLVALMEKHQPEGGHVPIAHAHPLYRAAIDGLLVFALVIDRLDGKAKLGQHKSPRERAKVVEALWRRGDPGDAEAIDAILYGDRSAPPWETAPDTPRPAFLDAPSGVSLRCALDASRAHEVAALLEGTYWNDRFSAETIARSHVRSCAWVGALDREGRVVGSARAISDGAKHAWVYDVIVASPFRGRGVGKALVRLLLDHPNVRGARFVHLGTRDAQELYEGIGFRDVAALPARPYATTTMTLERDA